MGIRDEHWRIRDIRGISLIEVTMLVVIVAIVMAVAMQSMSPGIENAKKRKTEHEMEAIIKAIAGDPSIMSVAGGVRSDFGYVGDVGAFPPNLEALAQNPGGYATWDGPYISPEYMNGFLTDEWGQSYTYNGGLDVESHGSGSPMRHRGSDDTLDILYNSIFGLVRDINDSVPGIGYDDSVEVTISVPNGAGGIVSKTYQPDSTGDFMLDSIPIGRHRVMAVYTPEVDTLIRQLTVVPRHGDDEVIRFTFASAWFSTEDTSGGGGADSMLTLVAGTEAATGSYCEDVTFDITNNTGESIVVTEMTVSWSSPTAYYQSIVWGGPIVFNSSSNRVASGQTADIDDQTIEDGDTVTIVIQDFKDQATGNGDEVDMGPADFVIEFSDGSIIEFTTSACP